jgi:hypothetical protein
MLNAHMRGCTMDLQKMLRHQAATVLVVVSYFLVNRNSISMHQEII